jgi:hypothetical protein
MREGGRKNAEGESVGEGVEFYGPESRHEATVPGPGGRELMEQIATFNN